MSAQPEKIAPATSDQQLCSPATRDHCITCSDEALPARVLSVDRERATAVVALGDTTTEIDITLINDVTPGATLLIHGGVALSLRL
jgi:HupF/HypC family protein